MSLKIHPEFWAIAEVQPEPKCRVSRDASSVIDNLGDTVRRNPNGLRKPAPRQPILVKNSSFNISPGVTGANSFLAIVLLPQ